MENFITVRRTYGIVPTGAWDVGALRNGTGTDRVVDTVVFVLTEISRIFEGYLG